MARYKQLLFYAAKLEKLPAEDHVPANKVEGCVSQVRCLHTGCTRTPVLGRSPRLAAPKALPFSTGRGSHFQEGAKVATELQLLGTVKPTGTHLTCSGGK
jgi:Fe-S metabolism associated domain